VTRQLALRSTVAAAAVLTVAALTGCGPTTDTTNGDGPSESRPSGVASATTQSPGPDTRPPRERNQDRDGDATQETAMEIEIRVGDESFTATVHESPAGRDLLDQLPQTITMSDHGGVEKTGPLESPLSLDGQPAGADPAVGDLGYYAPGNDLVLYYGDQSYYDGIVILGRLDDTATSRLAQMAGDVTATVTAADAS
jgi:hypothetical protein